MERDDVWVGELLEVLEFAHGVGRHALGVFLLDFDLLDGDFGVGVGAQVAEEDDGVCSFSEFFALDVFPFLGFVELFD